MDGRSKDIAAGEERSPASRPRGGTETDVFRVLSDGGPINDAEMLLEIRSRIRRSIEDPRPSLSLNQVDNFIAALVAKARADGGRA